MKTAQLQIRLSPAQKALLKRRAGVTGQDVSSYVLSLVAPDSVLRFERALAAVLESDGGRFALADLSDLLAELGASEFGRAVTVVLPGGLSPLTQNLVAAMVEHAAARMDVPAPLWAGDVLPLQSPWFATDLRKLRAHLLQVAPVAFRRRNLFVDATVGDRV